MRSITPLITGTNVKTLSRLLLLERQVDQSPRVAPAVKSLVNFFPREAPIYLTNLEGALLETTINELLPLAFDDSDL